MLWLLGLLQLSPAAEHCAALEAEKHFDGGKICRSLSSRSSYMVLCVCRMKYCLELTILCLCIWSTLNNKMVGCQLERSEVALVLMEIHYMAVFS